MFFMFSDFEPRIVRNLFLNTKGVASPKNLRNIFQSLLMLYYILELVLKNGGDFVDVWEFSM